MSHFHISFSCLDRVQICQSEPQETQDAWKNFWALALSIFITRRVMSDIILPGTWRIIPIFRWLITMVIVSPLSRVVPLPNVRTSWLYKWGWSVHHLLPGSPSSKYLHLPIRVPIKPYGPAKGWPMLKSSWQTLLQTEAFFRGRIYCNTFNPIGSMGLVYLPTFTIKINQM